MAAAELQKPTRNLSQHQNTAQAQQSSRETQVLFYLDYVNGLLRTYAASTGIDYEDLRQDAALTIMHCLEVMPRSATRSYVYTSVRNRIIDKIRYNRRRQAISLDAWREEIGDQDNGATPDDLLPSGYNTDPLTILLAQEQLETINTWMETEEARSRAANTRRMYRELADTVLGSLPIIEQEDTAWKM